MNETQIILTIIGSIVAALPVGIFIGYSIAIKDLKQDIIPK